MWSIRTWRRKRAAARYEVSAEQWARVEARLPLLEGLLGAADQDRLRALALEFLADKDISGAHGLVVSDDMRLEIALQAALPILNLDLDWYAGFSGIVVYPGDFVVPRSIADADGVVHEYDETVVGEAWEGGPVLLSWFEDNDELGDANVVIHEFAHQLDMREGGANGMPPLHAGMLRAQWTAAFRKAYRNFRGLVRAGRDVGIDPYAAECPAEFFAVLSEVFFEDPLLLRERYPQVYEQLAQFYRQDTAANVQAYLAQLDASRTPN
ncbi:MAG: zinc-dependent peptidase [Rhodocyclaceae bacterium]|nr:zinc-dependent peptidase [Rhodocyclaceae bacterium]MBX3667799.1 zinc-dependent peptidase [Rhodocyclaceae bacterium]